MYKLYGIPNCDTVKKARKCLDSLEIDYEFVDFKKTKPKKSDILNWKKSFGDFPVNTKGRTFRAVKDDFEAATSDSKINIIIENTSTIKRPILEKEGKAICFGFDQKAYEEL